MGSRDCRSSGRRADARQASGVGRGHLAALAFGAALLAAVLLAPGEARAGEGATVTASALNLRSGPGTWATAFAVLGTGEWVEILSGPTDGGWYEVSTTAGVGWVYGEYLSIGGAGGSGGWGGWGSSWDRWNQPWEAWQATTSYTAWAGIEALTVRAWAGWEADVVGYSPARQAITVTGEAVNGFVPIAFNGSRGWVWSGVVRFDGPLPERWIDVDRSRQMVTLYEGGFPVASYWGAMGFDQSADGFFATANGTYHVYSKTEELTWTEWGQAFVTDWVGFDPARANGFHSFSLDWYGNMLPWGAGPTGGCVALASWAADHVFAFADYGMRVEVHW